MTEQIRAVSYGGGKQSTALLVLAAQRRIDFRMFLFANVGDDSEHPATLEYVRQVAVPYAEHHGIDLRILDRIRRDGTVETLWQRLMDPIRCPDCKGQGQVSVDNDEGETRPCARCDGAGKAESRSLPIPIRMDNGAPGNRSCTADFKIRVIGRHLKRELGVTDANPAIVGIGISRDEISRANSRKVEPHERVVYPLISIGEDTGLSMSRQDCENLVAAEPVPIPLRDLYRRRVDAGAITGRTARQLVAADYATMPVPPKSSCFFCPFHKPSAWEDLARDEPELFERSCQLEDTLNKRRRMLGKDEVYLTRFAMPLRDAISGDQAPLFTDDDEGCDSGWCMT